MDILGDRFAIRTFAELKTEAIMTLKKCLIIAWDESTAI